MKYLKNFNTISEYNQFKEGDAFILPNVSYVQNDTVYFNAETAASQYIMVDLGLPSGRLWADRNVGASSPEDYGLYFQWGDTVGYTAEQIEAGEKTFDFYYSDYFDTTDGGKTFNKYAKDKLTVLEASDDAASVNMGSDWRMPTQAEMQELIDNTTRTYIDLQGNEFSLSEIQGNILEYNLKGIKFTGSNGNSIFIPAAGLCSDSNLGQINSDCNLWFSDLIDDDYSPGDINYFFADYNGDIMMFVQSPRCLGYSVRGVK